MSNILSEHVLQTCAVQRLSYKGYVEATIAGDNRLHHIRH